MADPQETLAQAVRAADTKGLFTGIPDADLEAQLIAANPALATQYKRTIVSSADAIAARHRSNRMRGLETEGPPSVDVNKAAADFALGNPGEQLSGAVTLIMNPGAVVKKVAGGALDTVKQIPQAAAAVYRSVMDKGPLGATVDAGKALLGAQVGEGVKAAQLAKQGRYVEAAGHGLAAALPILGPAAAAVGERAASGDVLGSIGEGGALIVSAAPTSVAREALGAARSLGIAEPIAKTAESIGAKRVASLMQEKGATSKNIGLRTKAETIAPDVLANLDDTNATRQGFVQQLANHLERQEGNLDTQTHKLLSGSGGQPVPLSTKLLEATLEDRLDAITSNPTKVLSTGEPVVNETARAAQIQDALARIRKVAGPQQIIDYGELRKIRADFDKTARAGKQYHPAVTHNYDEVMRPAEGAADVTGAIREFLSAEHPELAEANSQYALAREAHDLAKRAEEVRAARPGAGRDLTMKMLGFGGGALLGHDVTSAVAGALIAPAVDAGLRAGPTMKVVIARAMQQVSKALRTGDPASLDKALKTLQATTIGAQAARQR